REPAPAARVPRASGDVAGAAALAGARLAGEVAAHAAAAGQAADRLHLVDADAVPRRGAAERIRPADRGRAHVAAGGQRAALRAQIMAAAARAAVGRAGAARLAGT